jgi:hypothetical protein
VSGAASVGFGGVLAIEGGRRNVIILSARSLVATGGCPADPRSAPSAATMSGTLVARTRPRLGVLDAGRSCNDRVRERIARPELARAENELDGRREPKLQRPPVARGLARRRLRREHVERAVRESVEVEQSPEHARRPTRVLQSLAHRPTAPPTHSVYMPDRGHEHAEVLAGCSSSSDTSGESRPLPNRTWWVEAPSHSLRPGAILSGGP